MFQLTGISGLVRGMTWLIGEEPLALGRGKSSDIIVNEPSVSRKHCKLYKNNGLLHFANLGSDNSTLVNGIPARNSALDVGDEITVGSAVFIVSLVSVGAGDRPSEKGDGSGVSTIHVKDSLYVGEGRLKQKLYGRPRTVEDLASLFSFSRKLSEATTQEKLVSLIRVSLEARFRPLTVWIALSQANEPKLRLIQDEDGNDEEAPLELMRKALHERRALLIPAPKYRLKVKSEMVALFAPICTGEEVIGTVALEIKKRPQHELKGDLELLLAMASQMAPFFLSVKQIERLRRANEMLQSDLGWPKAFLGDSGDAERIRNEARTVAETSLNVLLLGESGTGKEVLARMIHSLSGRNEAPLIIVNCAAIPTNLFESELFGHEKGAFTGALEKRIGWVEEADKGTLFLDEVGDLSLENQAKILRAIDLGEFRRVGGKAAIEVDIRVIAATNKDIRSLASRGEFREDLLHRLSGYEITIPPLRERPSDISALAHHFFQRGLSEAKRPIEGISPDALNFLGRLPWPGNGRELKSCIERAIAFTNDGLIQVHDISTWSTERPQGDDNGSFLPLWKLERQHIERVLAASNGKMSDAAKTLDIGRTTLYKKVAEYGIKKSG